MVWEFSTKELGHQFMTVVLDAMLFKTEDNVGYRGEIGDNSSSTSHFVVDVVCVPTLGVNGRSMFETLEDVCESKV